MRNKNITKFYDVSLNTTPIPNEVGKLTIRNVTKIYETRKGNITAIDDCSLDIRAGELCVVVGPSGCGKTTLLNAIAGFMNINFGEIYLDDVLICNGRRTAPPNSERIVVFQGGALFPWKTVLENVIYGPIVQRNMDELDAKKMALQMLGMAGLKGIENCYPGEISSGMRRRVEILRALINNPKVLLLDEPYHASVLSLIHI